MTKAQAAALMLAAAGGAIAPTIASKVFTAAEAAAPKPYAHAVDLRRTAPDAGVSVVVYGTREAWDGGARADLGQSRSCKPTAASLKKAEDTMNALAKECTWER